ncbi:MAG: BolA family transcriptional regulator [Myxococcales bacterium]|nr:BolA family transcriptional regulator [Myxococcales bacterium]
MINAALAEELRGPLHALSMQVLTPEESAATPPLAPPPSPGTL